MGWKNLSFGDRLNVSLFILTIMAVLLAGWSLRVAQLTLDDAQDAGRDQKEQYKQETEQSKSRFEDEKTRSETQFTHQQETAEKSRKALVQAEGSLKQEASLLTRMQETSKSQLKLLDQQTKLQLEYAQGALPALRVQCDGPSTIMTVLETNAAGVPIPPKTRPEPLKADKQGLIYCRAEVSNGGRVDLEDVRLTVTTTVVATRLDMENYWVRVANKTRMPDESDFSPQLFHGSADLLSESRIAPTRPTMRPVEVHFTILVASQATEFGLMLALDSSNAATVNLDGTMSITREK